MTIDCLATEPHYLDHLLPVWRALAPEERGHLYVTPAVAHRRDLGPHVLGLPPRDSAVPVLVASYWDARRVHHRPVIMAEHGVGQTYRPVHDAYAGGGRRGHVILFLCPTRAVAAANRARYPDIPAVVVGLPRLDRWAGTVRARTYRPTVVVTSHWECGHVPETRSALPHYWDALPALAADPRWRLLGHSHPRVERQAAQLWGSLGVEFEPDFERVLERGDLLVGDNSSVLYEWAALDRPVVVLDAPWYRRDVEHGLRFWEYANVGVRVSEPDGLVGAVTFALIEPDPVRGRRQRIVDEVLGPVDGLAAHRAAAAIRETLAARQPTETVAR